MAVITIPKPLRDRLGEEATDAFAEFVKEIDLEARKDALALAEERLERRLIEEIGKVSEKITKAEEQLGRRLAEEIGKVNERMSHEIGKLRAEMKEETGKLRAEMKEDKSEVIKWMFIFWISQIGILSGIIFSFLKFIIK